MKPVDFNSSRHHSLNHEPHSADEEPDPATAQPVNWEKTSPVKPAITTRAKLDTGSTSTIIDKSGKQPSSQRMEPVKLRASNRRRNALNRYGLGVVISTVSLPVNDENKQTKAELLTGTAVSFT